MSLTVKQTSAEFLLPPKGNHVAICYGIVDLGHQQKVWSGERKTVPQVDIKWELCQELMPSHNGEQPRPFSITKRYTNCIGDKATLRHDLEGWLGRQLSPQELMSFELPQLLGTACLLTIIHEAGKKDSSKLYARVKGIGQLPKGLSAPPQFNKSVQYDIGQGKNATFLNFPQRLQDQISKSSEWQKATTATDEIGDGLLDL